MYFKWRREMKREFTTILLTVLMAGTLASPFYVAPAKASGTVYIHSDGSIAPVEAPISTSDKVTYTLTGDISDSIVVERSNIIIDGASHAVVGDGTGNGFKLTNISNVTIKNTNIENFTYGVYIESASSIVVQENNITANSYDGIGLFYSSSTTIAGNTITWNEYDGIENYHSSFCNVSGNYIAANGWFGIEIYDSSNNNIIENRVADNYNGIELFYSLDNSIFHNDFVNHTLQVSTVSSVAVWDNGYPSGGNYWSDYTGVDSNGDGIGDTPYPIDENNQDRYPLMKPWTNIAILDISPSKTVVGKGFTLHIYVSVQNQGWNTETFNITAYANATIITTLMNIALTSRNSLTLTFTWNTSGFVKGNYTIWAYAWPVPGETDTADNTCEDGWVLVSCVGDVNGDKKTTISDIVLVIGKFGTLPSSPDWNPNMDIDGNDKVTIADIVITIGNFGNIWT
jgi:parallel beta-helix repeat protein